MTELKIKLNQNYKSFQNGFEVSLSGNLVVLSGVNGSGKSQLMDIIRQYSLKDQQKQINADIKIEGNMIKAQDVIFRSLEESFNLQEIQQVGVNKITETKNQAWNAYKKYRLDVNHKEAEQFRKSVVKAKEILIKHFGEQKFNSGSLLQEEINDINFGEFSWEADDPFVNVIGDLFFYYAKKVHDKKLSYAGKNKIFKLDDYNEVPPWIRLNQLFEELNLDYRFENERDAYYLKVDDLGLNKIPQIYPLLEDGSINEDDPRRLADLSNGEKAIILLIFASFSNKSYKHKKILLLDEFDATFNPSLIESFYKLLNKYFVSKGVLVILSTHSPATISLAPENADFYEVFNKTKTVKRILPVRRSEYRELQVANKSFYKKVSDYKTRIKTLEEKISDKEKMYDDLLKSNESIIISEGYNFKYLKKAKDFFDAQGKYKIYDLKELGDSEIQKLFNFLLKTQNKQPKKIFILDCDSSKKFEDLKGLKTEFLIPLIFNVNEDNDLITKGIENLFDKNLFLDKEDSLNRRFFPIIIKDKGDAGKKEFPAKIKNGKLPDDSKKDFMEYICDERNDKKDFNNFKPIFEEIKKSLE